jgi:hypothetical protein
MSGANERNTVTVDGYTRLCLTAIVGLLMVLIVGLWATGPVSLTGQTVAAEIEPAGKDRGVLPNAGAQRLAILQAIQTTNGKLDRIANLLESGKLRVTVVEEKLAKPVKGVRDVTKPSTK